MKKSHRSMLKRVLFGRTAVIILLLALQLYLMFSGVKFLSEYSEYFGYVTRVIGIVLIIYIFNKEQSPSYKLVWMLPILIFPVFGTLFYIFVELNPGAHSVRERFRRLDKETRSKIVQNDAALLKLDQVSSRDASLARYLYNIGKFPVYGDTKTEYFSCGEDYFKALKESLKTAEKFIFLEYFFICEGVMWNSILEILKEKQGEGVEIRVIYDGNTPLSGLKFGYYKKLRNMGIHCRVFSPIRPALSTIQNNRDHRKIAVVDGVVAFTGGINLADEYINEEYRFGHWKDAGIRFTGEAARSFTAMFYDMWNAVGKSAEIEEETRKRLFGMNIPDPDVDITGGFVIPFADTPLDNETVGEYVYLDMINTAEDYLHIMTPYLILDDEMISTLIYSAKRGVETIIIMPHIPDKKMVYMLGRSYYSDLLRGGVRIFEYKPGFIHSKVVISDDIKATVGTINFDYRSFYLHFECGAYLYGCDAVATAEEDYQKTLDECIEITLDDCKNYGILKRITGRVLRLFAPLM